MAAEAPQISSSRSNGAIPLLSAEEEDQVILARITNDERPLKRVMKKFHNYTSLSHPPIVPVVATSEQTLDDAREAFLLDLASFHLSLKKGVMICEAETRQVEEYQRERQEIEREHTVLRDQIEQLKAALEEAQVSRRQKMEYDLVAEKVNTLPSREELEHSIELLENDLTTIRTEHDLHNRTLVDQKASLDAIISQLDLLRFLGKDKDAASVGPSRVASPSLDVGGDMSEDIPESMSTAAIEVSSGLEAADSESIDGTVGRGDDIEMGEVEEDPKPKKKAREELEEGEASDTSSALSDPPDDL
ncbi:hypothetical protein H0H93_000086 [Arthromyces matolae]|nr:hypothetical protein H0H93_000086 [Arthromyces matolae]